jgi:hypothetical protein
MKAKGVIRQQVQWAQSRTFFYWRLRRRLLEFEVVNSIFAPAAASSSGRSGKNERAIYSDGGSVSGVDAAGARKRATQELHQWFLSHAHAQTEAQTEAQDAAALWESDRDMVAWFDRNAPAVRAYVAGVRGRAQAADVADKLAQLVGSCSSSADALKAALLQGLSDAERNQLLAALK